MTLLYELDEATYHAHPALSQSGAKTLLKSPAQYQWERQHPVYKDVFDEGSAAHRMVLDAGPVLAVCPADSWRTKDAQEFRDTARKAGMVPVLPDTFERVMAMADRLSSHPLASQLLTGGCAEVSAFATDPATGVPIRGRVDYLTTDLAVDYKTSATCDPKGFGRTCFNFGYHMQAAWYNDLLDLAGSPIGAFAFIVQSKEPPYDVFVAELTDRAVDLGRARNREALERFRDCTASGIWPGPVRDDAFVTTDLPAWAYRNADELEEVTI